MPAPRREHDPGLLLGVDIGGTKTAVCLGTAAGELKAAHRFPTRPLDGAGAWFDRARDAIGALCGEAQVREGQIGAVGIAAPGPVNVPAGCLLAPPNLPGWDEVPVVDWFRRAYGRPVHMNNDANAAALAEYLYGSCKGTPDLVYLTLSTGLGAGVVSGGRLVQGVSDLAGEIGHGVLDPDGPPCPCGLRGCFEVYCGGRSVARRLRERIRAGGLRTAVVDEAGGDPEAIDFAAFLRAVRRGDAFACGEWETFTGHLAHGIGLVLMAYNPGAVVLGTIGIHAGRLLLDPLEAALPRYAWPRSIAACRILPSALGHRIGELGAVAVAAAAAGAP